MVNYRTEKIEIIPLYSLANGEYYAEICKSRIVRILEAGELEQEIEQETTIFPFLEELTLEEGILKLELKTPC